MYGDLQIMCFQCFRSFKQFDWGPINLSRNFDHHGFREPKRQKSTCKRHDQLLSYIFGGILSPCHD